jgi:hypothetical protein
MFKNLTTLLFIVLGYVANAQVSGTVFRDLNANGTKDNTASFNEIGIKDVTVKAYDATGAEVGTTTTSATGTYSFTGLTLPLRVEFTNFGSSSLYPASQGTNNTSSVQFYTAATTTADFAVNNPAHYSQPNPNLATPKHLTGNPFAAGTNMANDPALYRFPNTATGNAQSGGTPTTTLGTQSQLGSTWGVAYDRNRKKLFLASVYKRHAPLGPGETGGRIYFIDNPNSASPTAPAKFVDLVSDLAISVGTIQTNSARGLPANKSTATEDPTSFSQVGKVGLGDIDISDDGQFLFVVNLFDKKIYKIDIAQAVNGTPNAVALPDYTLTCNNGTSRPWGMGMWDGELYLGVVCDALTGANSDLRLTVQKFNFTSNTWTEVFNVTPDWNKGDIIFGAAKHKWQKWADSWSNFIGPSWPTHPSPIIGDIEFDEEGSMHLAVLDRMGFQTGHRQKKVPDDNGLYSGITGGELLRTYKNPTTGVFSLENNGACGPYNTGGTGNNSQTGQGGPNTLQGPGNGEFYCDDNTGSDHSETTSGGLAMIKGSRKIASIQMDPIDGQVDAQGITWFNTSNGLETQEYQIFQNAGTPSPDFSKQNGLGDVEFLSDAAPIEIGNRVWFDSDGDGIQDAGETGIAGVVVELYQGATLVGTTTTNAAGNYYFNNSNVNLNGASGILPSTTYCVRVPNVIGGSKQGALGSNTLSLANADASSNGDERDSDGSLNGSDAEVCFTTGFNGANNHSYDFGFKPQKSCLGNYVWNDENQDGLQNNGEVGVSGVTTTLYNATTNVILATVTTDAYGFYQFCGLNPGDYKVGFSLPTNYVFTGSNTGGDDTIDSDPSNITGLTATITLASGDSNMTVDAGIYQPQPTTSTVGDRVWFDANNNGTQDPGEQGVSGVTVTLYNCANPTTPIATTITGANGNYIFENVAPGSYSVSFTAPIGTTFTSQTGSVSTTNNSDADATGKTACFPVLAGDQITYVDAGIIPQTVGNASIGDKVWNDANQDGIQDPTETGVAGVTVTLYDASGTTVISTTTTDGLGNYGFNDLAPGCYVVGFGLPVGYTRTLQGAGSDTTKNSDANTTTGLTSQVCVSAGQNNSTIDAGIYNASNTNSLGDKVWYDVDKDGIQDVGEYGYPGVVVTLYDCTTNTIQATTTTDANGNYLFDGIANGSYYVGFGFIPGFQFTGANADVAGILGGNNSDANPSSGLTACVSLIGNTNITTVDAGIYPGNTRNATSSLGDIVWLDANSNGLQDNGETGVPGVTATLINATTNAVLATTITDGLGNYIFTNLDGGNYKVEFSNIPVGYTFTTQGSNIEDEDNSDANPATGMTNSIPLGVGEDKMSVDAGIVAPLGTVCLGDYVWIDLDNDGVQEANEPAVPGVTVKLYDNNTNTVLQVATTNREGQYLFCGLTTGNTYSVGFENLPAGFTFTTSSGALSTPDNSDANPVTGRTTTVTLGATNDLTLDAGIYSPTTAVVGNYVWYDEDADGIQDPTEAPIPGVLVTLYDNTNTPVASAVTDANGGYLFTNVAPGTYTIGFEGYPSTLIPTTKGANPSADDDSNIDPITGRTDAFIVTPGSSNLTLDAGYKANPIAGLGNYVWYDINENGLQDASEPGISGVIVSLFESDGSTLIATAITDGNGAYSFPNLPAGSYVVGFTAPAGYTRTKSLGGLNDALNSDVDVTNKTAVVTLIAGEYNPNIDAGYYIGVPLPAKVLQATLANMTSANTCKVSWYTKDEENTQRFEIERGVNRQEFEKVATHKASGQTFGLTNYSVVDDLSTVSSNAVVYYRIKLIDIDGKFTYSNVISAVRGSSNDALMIYPNPFENALNIDYVAESDDVLELTLTDLSGRVVSRMQKTITKGANKITWNNLGSLSSGQYYIRVSSLENGNSYLRKLNK